ncbi:MAG: hypothetical protein U1F43_02290 [Myxococcota bacterium]
MELAVFDFAPGARVFFGPDAAGHASGAVAVETGARAWTLFDAARAPRGVSLAEGCEVIGLARAAPSSPVLGLVVLDAERRQASHLLPDGVKEIARAPRPVASACVSRAFGHLAWRAESGEIAVVDIVSGANLVTLATGAKDGA